MERARRVFRPYQIQLEERNAKMAHTKRFKRNGYSYPAWFFNPSEGQLVRVAGPRAVPVDPDTGEKFTDLTAASMRESDEWFEYATRKEAMRGISE
jgi:hypothetical protein